MTTRFAKKLLGAGALLAFSLTGSGCLSHYVWESRLSTTGRHEEGRQHFNGNLSEAWVATDKRIALSGVMTMADESGGKSGKSGYLLIDAKDSGVIGYGFVRWKNLMDGKEVSYEMKPDSVSFLAYRRPQYGLRGGYGQFSHEPVFVEKSELNPESAGYARLVLKDGQYPFVVGFYEKEYSTTGEVLDKSGKVLLTPLTVATDVATVAVATPFVVCFGIPYAVIYSLNDPFPREFDGHYSVQPSVPSTTDDARAVMEATGAYGGGGFAGVGPK